METPVRFAVANRGHSTTSQNFIEHEGLIQSSQEVPILSHITFEYKFIGSQPFQTKAVFGMGHTGSTPISENLRQLKKDNGKTRLSSKNLN
jgi:hypothetical protein